LQVEIGSEHVGDVLRKQVLRACEGPDAKGATKAVAGMLLGTVGLKWKDDIEMQILNEAGSRCLINATARVEHGLYQVLANAATIKLIGTAETAR
jgi:hypothetical protein